MSETLIRTAGLDEVYPELAEIHPGEWLDRFGAACTGWVRRRLKARRPRVEAIVDLVAAAGQALHGVDRDGLRVQAMELRKDLRRDGFRDELVARSFALIRETAHQVLGMRHFDVQLMGGWVLLNGMVAEMETGEGKTLTATLPACTAALAGIPVHVITVNDYLVERDCALMAAVYQTLGITVAAVTAEMDHGARQAAYACDVVYCTNKTVVFDYLRDRILLGANSSALHLRLEKIYGGATRSRRLLLRGLNFAIVDEADSVLVDEARTPLIISSEVGSGDEALVAEQALDLARAMRSGEDFHIHLTDRRLRLTEAGHQRLIVGCRDLGGVWAGSLRREELLVQALTALHLFHRDEHYLVRDGKIQVIDEFTGRVMADRSWGQGLHQLIEAKEGCTLTTRREPLARISYQRFFRRYLHLSGMTGTGTEVRGELGSVYGLAIVPIPTNHPSRRQWCPDRIFETMDEKWAAIGQRIADLHRQGVPILLGTRSVAASEIASQHLAALGLEHEVLNAKQDGAEAAIVARAGAVGGITIATNMAGRGTDIKLDQAVIDRGGLHVILSERHEAGRIDRQLAGRCARQGDPGCFEAILSLEDALLEPYRGGLLDWLLLASTRPGTALGARARYWFMRWAQMRTEFSQSRIRKRLLRMDQQMGDVLSFSGRPE